MHPPIDVHKYTSAQLFPALPTLPAWPAAPSLPDR